MVAASADTRQAPSSCVVEDRPGAFTVSTQTGSPVDRSVNSVLLNFISSPVALLASIDDYFGWSPMHNFPGQLIRLRITSAAVLTLL